MAIKYLLAPKHSDLMLWGFSLMRELICKACGLSN